MTEPAQNFGGRDAPFVKGDTREITIKVIDEAGAPKTITGATKRWQAWKDGVVKITKADGDISIVSVDGIDDALRFSLAPADTLSLAVGPYQHECEIVLSGATSTVAQGVLTLTDHLII